MSLNNNNNMYIIFFICYFQVYDGGLNIEEKLAALELERLEGRVSNGRSGIIRPPAAMDDMLYGSNDSVSRGNTNKFKMLKLYSCIMENFFLSKLSFFVFFFFKKAILFNFIKKEFIKMFSLRFSVPSPELGNGRGYGSYPPSQGKKCT